MNSFVAIDVETANADLASICQIGLAKYENGLLVDEYSSLINPLDYFDPVNVSIHGIRESDVKLSPTFKDIFEEVTRFINNNILISHTHFDRVGQVPNSV